MLELTVVDEKTTPLYTGDLERDLSTIRTVKQAMAIVGGLSKPSKMPSYAYNLPASRCKMGGRLNTVPGSVCYGCYAADTIEWTKRKCAVAGKWALTRYTMHQVQDALEKRYQSLSDPMWVPAMVFLIRHFATPNVNRGREAVEYFRWHDSGDLQDANHLANICIVAENTPDVDHWLPTREYNIVHKSNPPENLCIRLSAHMENGSPPNGFGFPTSTVSTGDKPENGGDRCHAPDNEGKCGDCRKCWDRSVENVDYLKH
jgi:hypothetical protein